MNQGRRGHPAARRLVLGATVGASLAVSLALLRPKRVVVEGPSMLPVLEPGDRLFVGRARRVRPGDVVAVRDPRDVRRILVKRVSAVVGDDIEVLGDNPVASTDSRAFGPLSRRAVVGRVLWPPTRTRRAGRRIEASRHAEGHRSVDPRTLGDAPW